MQLIKVSVEQKENKKDFEVFLNNDKIFELIPSTRKNIQTEKIEKYNRINNDNNSIPVIDRIMKKIQEIEKERNVLLISEEKKRWFAREIFNFGVSIKENRKEIKVDDFQDIILIR